MDMAENIPPTAEAPALVVKNVSHSFGDNRALNDVSLEIPRGRFVVLLGLNGAGKSTLFALITRLYDNVTGEIRIFGEDIRRRAMAALQRLGVVFQSRTLDLDLTLKQNLLYHCALHGISGREARKRTEHALEIVGLADRAKEKVRNLSGGQMRRLEIAFPFCISPRCCCSTSRRSASISARARASSRSCAPSSKNKGSACCGRPISSTRYGPPISSSCCTRAGCCSPDRCPSFYPKHEHSR